VTARTTLRYNSITAETKDKIIPKFVKAGFSDRIVVRLQVYRALPVPAKPYDIIISVEILEGVGQGHLATYCNEGPSQTNMITDCLDRDA